MVIGRQVTAFARLVDWRGLRPMILEHLSSAEVSGARLGVNPVQIRCEAGVNRV